MIWQQIKVGCKTEEIEQVSAIMSMIDANLMIEDYSDVDEGVNKIYGELLDEEILAQDKTKAHVSLFLSSEKDANEVCEFLNDRFVDTGMDVSIQIGSADEDDWAETWKQYYKPIHIGKQIVIVPMWEMYEAKHDEIVVKIDPGMAFGTGSHETTRLCGELIEKHINTKKSVLDIGTGSGILSILSAKLGAKTIDATDIDTNAVRIANENFADNDVSFINCFVSDLLDGVHNKYGTIIANIVADIIIRLAPDLSDCLEDDGKVILSGIIERQAGDVEKALNVCQFKLLEKISENDWNAFVFVKDTICNKNVKNKRK